MYAVTENENIIGIHDKLSVCEIYRDSILRHHKEKKLKIKKIKKKESINNQLDDLYLVRYGENYVQAGFITSLEIVSDQIVEDDKFALDILYRIVETRKLKEKQRKKLVSAIKILETIYEEDNDYVPSIEDLQLYQSRIEEYRQIVKGAE